MKTSRGKLSIVFLSSLIRRNRNRFVMQQCVFDEFIQFVLETVSSEEYLKDIGIIRPASINWTAFQKQITKQTVRPGIYPRSFGRGQGVHYYAVRKEKDDTLTVANGYPSAGGLNKEYSIGLDVQPDHSHGLCQTYALMYYFRQESKLKTGAYWENVAIGLKFLLEFIGDDSDRERCWSPNDLLQNITILCPDDIHTQERSKVLKKLKGKRKDICLSDVIKVLLANKDNLRVWFGKE